MVKRRGIAALALGMALVIAAVGCAEDDDFLIGGKRPSSNPTIKPGGSGGSGGGDGSDIGGGIGAGDKPVATPTPAPTPSPTPSPTPPPSGTLVHSYPLQRDTPEGIAFDAQGNAWVANYGDGVVTSAVTKLSDSGQLLAEPAVGIGPKQLVVDKVGNAWVVNHGGGSITKITPDGERIHVSVGDGPRDLAFNPQDDTLWIALERTEALVKLDPTSMATESVVPVAAKGIAFHDNQVWVSYAASSSVGVYDLDGSLDREVMIGSRPGLIRADSEQVWVLTSNGLTRINPATGQWRDISEAGTLDLALDSEGNAWITSSSTKLVKKYGPDGAFLNVYPVGTAPHGLAFHPKTGRLWVTDRDAKRVHVLVP